MKVEFNANAPIQMQTQESVNESGPQSLQVNSVAQRVLTAKPYGADENMGVGLVLAATGNSIAGLFSTFTASPFTGSTFCSIGTGFGVGAMMCDWD